MNKRATETTLINTLVDSMSLEDFRQYVANDMKDFLYHCSESEVVNEFLIKVNLLNNRDFWKINQHIILLGYNCKLDYDRHMHH